MRNDGVRMGKEMEVEDELEKMGGKVVGEVG